MKNLKGVFTALITPFDKNDNINEKALEALIEKQISAGVSGFYACGSAAEVFLLSHEERVHLMELVKDIVKGRATLIAHVGAISTKEMTSLALKAEQLGYDVVSAVAPFYYKFKTDEVLEYYNELASATSLKTLIYNIPSLSGVSLGADQLGKMLEDDRYLGVKYTSNDFFALETIKSHHKDKLIYNGCDEMLMSGLAAGADGGIGATYNIMPDKFVKIYSLFCENKIDEARKIQHEVNEIIRSLMKVGTRAGLKAVLNMQGVDFGYMRKPFFDCTKEDCAIIEREVLPKL